MALMWSRYVHFTKVKKNYCLFHSLNFCVICIDHEMSPTPYKLLSQNEVNHMTPELLNILKAKKMIIKTPEEDRLLKNEILSKNQMFDIRNLILLISNDCNMDCSYCQIEKNIIGSKKIMSLDVAFNAIHLFDEICSKKEKLTINFTGGEPLLNFDVIRSLVRFIKSSNTLKKARLVIFTNGTLINQEIAEFFKDNEFLVIISLDGDNERHNRNRKYLDRTSTYEQSLEGYTLAQKMGCSCAISSVADLNDADFDTYIEWIVGLKPLSVGINYPHLLLSSKKENIDFCIYTDQILKAHKILSKKGISLENYERFSRKYNQNEIRRRECQACGRGITVDANGNIGTCKSLLVSGEISYPLASFNLMNIKEFHIWANRTPLNNETCLNCPAISICGGGCAYDAYCLFDGNACEMDRRLCSHTRNIFYDLLENRVCAVTQPFVEYLLLEPTVHMTDGKVFDSVGH